MRNHVIDELVRYSFKNKKTFLITADLGFNVLDTFEKEFPNRFLNVGIAEQNMASIAAGLALEGNMVFMYSIGNFPTLRCIEQIRNNICYHNANVKILSVGGGFAYGDLGMTHHATEDLAMMRSLPNMRIFVPSDEVDAIECFKAAISFDGPAFIRMAKGKEEVFHNQKDYINPYELQCYSEVGKDINIISIGTLLGECKKLCQMLSEAGISAGAFSVLSLKPLPSEQIKTISKQCHTIITMEEHNVVGGLGGAIAEAISEIDGPHSTLYRFGLQDCFTSEIGNQKYLRDYYNISAEKIFKYLMEHKNK